MGVVTNCKRIIVSAGLLAMRDDVTTITAKERPRLVHKHGEVELTRFGALLFFKNLRPCSEVNVADVDDPGEEEQSKEQQAFDAVVLPSPSRPNEAATASKGSLVLAERAHLAVKGLRRTMLADTAPRYYIEPCSQYQTCEVPA